VARTKREPSRAARARSWLKRWWTKLTPTGKIIWGVGSSLLTAAAATATILASIGFFSGAPSFSAGVTSLSALPMSFREYYSLEHHAKTKTTTAEWCGAYLRANISSKGYSKRVGIRWRLTDNVTGTNKEIVKYLNPGPHNVPRVSQWWQRLRSQVHTYTVWASVYPPGSIRDEKVVPGAVPTDEKALTLRRKPASASEGTCRIEVTRSS
jgi:hypothetical protein